MAQDNRASVRLVEHGAPPARPRSDPSGQRPALAASLTTLLVTDLVGSTALVERLGDARATRLFTRLDAAARALLAAHHGREIDKTDGFLLLFERPVEAVAFALAYHAELAQFGKAERVALSARVGIHVGEVFVRGNPAADVQRGAKPLEVDGLAKVVAARLMTLAEGGQTLLSRAAFDLTRPAAAEIGPDGARLAWLAHGTYRFKGIEGPAEVFEVGVPGVAPLRPPAGSAKAQPAGSGKEVLGWRPAVGQYVPGRPQWRLERKLGAGGSGEAWLARHSGSGEPRVVKFCFGQEQVRALQREVTLCRVLRETLPERPDITRILDWHLDEPPFFLEFEYQGGVTLTEWAQAQGGLEAVPLATRLEVMAQAAEAVAAAHSVGVLHKDIKPSNILVIADEAGPRVQVTDFGIGALTEPARVKALGITVLGLTQDIASSTSSTAGTPLYVAPEILEGKPATLQADVWSLGVLLYQMLVGDFTRVLAPGWEREVEDEVLRADLATFVDGRPERRVASAGEVAQRLRTLPARREQARLARLAEAEAASTRRALERARRRRRVAVSGALAATAVAVALALLARGLAAERDRANLEAAAAQRVTDFLIRLFSVSDPSEARGNTITARELLDRGAAQLAEELADQPVLQARLEDAIGTVYVQLGLLDEGERLLRHAWERRRRHLGERHLESANSEADLGLVAEKRGDIKAAAEHYRRALDMRRALGFDADQAAVKLHASLGWALTELARWDEARDHIRTAQKLQNKLPEEDSSARADILTSLAYVHYKLGEYREAAEVLRQLLALQERALGHDSMQAAATKNNLAVVLREMGELDEALQLYLEALAVQERALGPQHADLGSFLNNIAHIHQDRGDLKEALAYFRRALEVRRAALGEENPETALSINNLAYCLWLAGELDAAAALFNRALTLREQLLGSDHPEVAFTRANLALVAVARGEWEAASDLFQRAITSASVAFGGDRPSMIPMLEGFEALLRYRGEGAEADEIATRIRALRESAAKRGEHLPPPVVVRFPATAAGALTAGAR